MFGLFLFFLCLLAAFFVSFLDVKKVFWPSMYSDKPICFFLFDVLKSFVYFFVSVSFGSSLVLMPALGFFLVIFHDCILVRCFTYRFYSIFATTFGFLLFFVPGLSLLTATVFGVSFLFCRNVRWSLMLALTSVPCLVYGLYSYAFFKFLTIFCIGVFVFHYWHMRKIEKLISFCLKK